ncbi:hypothetical protein EDB89DRAFT_2068999 [Lactarius sanguifluus]|nr:hypothetical protein EDB89DRAFT_2068999 [Lactarius sanguifluus]
MLYPYPYPPLGHIRADASELTSVFLRRHYSMHGVTFLSYDASSSAQPLSPPHRLFFPAVSTFTDHPGPVDENIPRRLSNIGVAPETLKAAYPSLAGRSMRATSMTLSALAHPVAPARPPPWAPMFAALEAAEDWFDRVRYTLARYFGAPDEDTAMGTRTVTYLARQDSLEGERLRRCWTRSRV